VLRNYHLAYFCVIHMLLEKKARCLFSLKVLRNRVVRENWGRGRKDGWILKEFRVEFSNTIGLTHWPAAPSKDGHPLIPLSALPVFLTHSLSSTGHAPSATGKVRNKNTTKPIWQLSAAKTALFLKKEEKRWPSSYCFLHLLSTVLCPHGSPGSKPGWFSPLALEW